MQIRDLPIHPLENLFSCSPHPTTGNAARMARLEERREFLQREPDPHRTPNELHTLDDRRRIAPEPATRSGRCRQQAHSLVVSNQVGTDPGACGDLADAEGAVYHASIIG